MSAAATPSKAPNTREAILRSAARIFAQSGYRAATMQAIATDAGCTPPTLYAHFGSKKGIFEGLVEVVMREIYGALGRQLPDGLNLAQRLELRVRDVLELAERQRDVFVVFIVRPYDLPELDQYQDDHAVLQQHWVALFERHPDELGDRTPQEAALVIDGVLYSSVNSWLRSGEDSIAHRTRRIVDLVLNGISAG